jgi:hypothetical protein
MKMVSFKQWVLNIIFRHAEEPVLTHQLPCDVLTDHDHARAEELVLRMRWKDMPTEVVLNERTNEWTVYTDSTNVVNARMQLLGIAVERQNKRHASYAS